ncbi:MAG: hypothetical protein SFY69_06760 [Planctomycetota bacterium]|nr:hypothetical protein [Planctomycetota bacterium]
MSVTPSMPMLLGYHPRQPRVVTGDLCLPGVRVVCSASRCLSAEIPKAPEWDLLNETGSYRDAVAARDAGVRAGARDFEVHSYRLYPVLFTKRGPIALALPSSDAPEVDCATTPCPTRLGLDVVSLQSGCFKIELPRVDLRSFGCSPLSCNGFADEIPVNPLCPLDDMALAGSAAERFAIEEPEPGPYVIVEIARCAVNTEHRT